MFGKNQIMNPSIGDGSQLDVVKIFPTIQGEGPRAGQPAIFIRLGGCNLACNFCDTEFDNFTNMTLSEISAQISEFRKGQKLVVITGGEPLRQNIAPLCELLLAQGFIVQIETNGTLWQNLPESVEIVCSPKIKTQIRPDLLSRISAFKFLVSKTLPNYKSVPEVGQSLVNAPIYVQAIDEYDAQKNATNLSYVQELAVDNGYILSVQIHKILNIE
jgi:organic radical activating enzyme